MIDVHEGIEQRPPCVRQADDKAQRTERKAEEIAAESTGEQIPASCSEERPRFSSRQGEVEHGADEARADEVGDESGEIGETENACTCSGDGCDRPSNVG